MSEWVSVDDKFIPENSKGIWDSKKYLCHLNNGHGIVIATRINNRWDGFPAGSTDVTHWMELPDDPE